VAAPVQRPPNEPVAARVHPGQRRPGAAASFAEWDSIGHGRSLANGGRDGIGPRTAFPTPRSPASRPPGTRSGVRLLDERSAAAQTVARFETFGP
jgi:hypothetical protein